METKSGKRNVLTDIIDTAKYLARPTVIAGGLSVATLFGASPAHAADCKVEVSGKRDVHAIRADKAQTSLGGTLASYFGGENLVGATCEGQDQNKCVIGDGSLITVRATTPGAHTYTVKKDGKSCDIVYNMTGTPVQPVAPPVTEPVVEQPAQEIPLSPPPEAPKQHKKQKKHAHRARHAQVPQESIADVASSLTARESSDPGAAKCETPDVLYDVLGQEMDVQKLLYVIDFLTTDQLAEAVEQTCNEIANYTSKEFTCNWVVNNAYKKAKRNDKSQDLLEHAFHKRNSKIVPVKGTDPTDLEKILDCYDISPEKRRLLTEQGITIAMLSPYVDLVDETGSVIPLTKIEKEKAIHASYHSFGKVMRLTPDVLRDMVKTKFPGAEKDRIVVQTGDVLYTGATKGRPLLAERVSTKRYTKGHLQWQNFDVHGLKSLYVINLLAQGAYKTIFKDNDPMRKAFEEGLKGPAKAQPVVCDYNGQEASFTALFTEKDQSIIPASNLKVTGLKLVPAEGEAADIDPAQYAVIGVQPGTNIPFARIKTEGIVDQYGRKKDDTLQVTVEAHGKDSVVKQTYECVARNMGPVINPPSDPLLARAGEELEKELDSGLVSDPEGDAILTVGVSPEDAKKYDAKLTRTPEGDYQLVIGDVPSKPGKYPIMIEAVDKNGNKGKGALELIVSEEVVASAGSGTSIGLGVMGGVVNNPKIVGDTTYVFGLQANADISKDWNLYLQFATDAGLVTGTNEGPVEETVSGQSVFSSQNPFNGTGQDVYSRERSTSQDSREKGPFFLGGVGATYRLVDPLRLGLEFNLGVTQKTKTVKTTSETQVSNDGETWLTSDDCSSVGVDTCSPPTTGKDSKLVTDFLVMPGFILDFRPIEDLSISASGGVSVATENGAVGGYGLLKLDYQF